MTILGSDDDIHNRLVFVLRFCFVLQFYGGTDRDTTLLHLRRKKAKPDVFAIVILAFYFFDDTFVDGLLLG
ncbi:hypothetical protein V8F06_009955 [Rhypophila decipiens]